MTGPAVEAAFLRLAARLVELDDTGTTWPCRNRGDLWYSDDADERAAAAELCAPCPALDECGRYAAAARERHGVWAGRDRTPCRRKENDR
ncbi:WhiB family transcriptional regulator [Quadrisphaera sp. GCM10027208]|uniref:WhiB family transcriptional regulator n=1 Tax=Quadrisphaera sp. GCM10027208 TaxID=3273423 RepID=UPI00360C96AC